MKRFKFFNNLVGWIVFAIAAATYLLTIEPTASFWDCGEFISSAFKLEVGHPPGAPFFIMTGRLASLLASDTAHVAMMVNAMSAMFSAFTILFLFWTITRLARKIFVQKDGKYSCANDIATLGAGVVGALAYTFSDTFWFSAVEGEVYAYSSFFTAIVFWLILKWEDNATDASGDRWLILIAYLMGLSIGVHLLNLLTIPALVLVYYFKKYEPNFKGVCLALIASVAILAFVLYGLIPGFVKVASWFELLFTNKFGLPFNTGLSVYIVVATVALAWAIYETQFGKSERRTKVAFLLSLTLIGIPFLGDNVLIGLLIVAAVATFLFAYKKAISRRLLNTIVLCATLMLVGYASYAMIVIRSSANTPMDQNSPEDVFSLQGYLNREQYGDRPLVYGAVYNAPLILETKGGYCEPIEKEGKSIWMCKEKDSAGEKDSYINAGRRHAGYKMDSRFMMLFPRMYSTRDDHISAYKSWGDIKGRKYKVDRCGRTETIACPTFAENLRFFFSYQLNFMYWRYFMWNFSGRQNDIQGFGEIDHGNWISGISVIDNAMLGDQSQLPDVLKNNKGHNRYFMLPLLLGILGIVWQLTNGKKGTQSFWLTFTLFFMTGIAIVIYLNQTPFQPRERDYAYAGSFYAFCIWIGLGVLLVHQYLQKIPGLKRISAILATLICLPIPALMAQQNWDDHDRSGRYVCRDFGANYLNSCQPNAIYFCNGDNDTFPVWYNMEVEGTNTDMRACNLSYLSTDWYIDQMRRGAYESQPLPISWERKDYVSGHLDVCRVTDHPRFGGSMLLSEALKLVRDTNFIAKDGVGNFFASTLKVPVDRQKVIESGAVDPKWHHLIVDTIEIKLGRMVQKSELMVLEMINSNNWERPMYFAITVGDQYYPNIRKHLQYEGTCFRFVPIDVEKNNCRVNTDRMYENMLTRFRYGGLKENDIYIDETVSRQYRTCRMMFAELAEALIHENDFERAEKALDFCFAEIPASKVPHDYVSAMMSEYYFAIGQNDKGDAILAEYSADLCQRLDWLQSLSKKERQLVSREMGVQQSLGMLQNILYSCRNYRRPLQAELQPKFEAYYQALMR